MEANTDYRRALALLPRRLRHPRLDRAIIAWGKRPENRDDPETALSAARAGARDMGRLRR